MTTTTTTIRDFADRQVAWFAEQVAPPIADLWERLDVPEYRIYKDALRDFSRDSWEALKSTYRLLFLTLRPICILLWIILQFLWRNLLEHGGRSLQHGFQQLKYASVVFWKFQRSLSRTELLGEAGIVATLVAAYYFRKWLKRQTYWARTVRWYRGKKEQMVQVRKQFFCLLKIGGQQKEKKNTPSIVGDGTRYLVFHLSSFPFLSLFRPVLELFTRWHIPPKYLLWPSLISSFLGGVSPFESSFPLSCGGWRMILSSPWS
jgi:hypothetical protein